MRYSLRCVAASARRFNLDAYVTKKDTKLFSCPFVGSPSRGCKERSDGIAIATQRSIASPKTRRGVGANPATNKKKASTCVLALWLPK